MLSMNEKLFSQVESALRHGAMSYHHSHCASKKGGVCTCHVQKYADALAALMQSNTSEVDPEEQKLDQILGNFVDEARGKLKKALKSSAIPEEWLSDKESFLLQKAVLDSLCRDRPFRPLLPAHAKEFDNLHSML